MCSLSLQDKFHISLALRKNSVTYTAQRQVDSKYCGLCSENRCSFISQVAECLWATISEKNDIQLQEENIML